MGPFLTLIGNRTAIYDHRRREAKVVLVDREAKAADIFQVTFRLLRERFFSDPQYS
jgi:hypothetical protein